MAKPLLHTLALAGLGLCFAGQAHAMSCDDIMSMVSSDVAAPLIIQTMKSSGKDFTAGDVSCLRQRRAPAEVVQAAQESVDAARAQQAPAAPAEPQGGFSGTQMLGSELPETDAPPETGGPAEIEQLVQRYNNKQYQTCSKGFFDLLQAGSFPEHQSRIQYYLAQCLYDLGDLHAAQHHYMEVLRRGPNNPYFKYALPRLVSIAQFTGNDVELLRIVDRVPPEAFPRRAQNHLFYLMGRKLWDDQELSQAASYLSQISTQSELYMRGKYIEGIIASEQGRYRTAVQAFREVMQSEPPLVGDAQRLQEVEDLKDLALMNIARIYFGLERFDNADQFYSMVDRESTYWPESLFERAWTQFWKQDLNQALGLLLTVSSPYFTDEEYVPEVTILRALTFFNLCEYNEVEQILIQFEADTTAAIAEMSAFIDQYRSEQHRQLADQAYDAYFTRDHASSQLDQAMFRRILRNRDLAALVRHLDLMDQEVEGYSTRQPVWQSSVGDSLKQVIEADRQRYKRQAGLVLLREMSKQLATLQDLMIQSEIIRFEVTDAQRQDYEYRMQNPEVDSLSHQAIDFATSTDIIYWPFNGEFWADELGYYRYTEHGSCK